MRLMTLAFALLLTVAIDALGSRVEAQNQGRWCQLDRSWTVVNCSFRTFRQCQATISGVGGLCQRNAKAPPPRARRVYR